MWLNFLTLFISITLYVLFSLLTNPNDLVVENIKHMHQLVFLLNICSMFNKGESSIGKIFTIINSSSTLTVMCLELLIVW